MYDPGLNRLGGVGPGENSTRYISCINLHPKNDRVFGVQIDGDEIWVPVGPHQNQRRNRKIGCLFSSLTGDMAGLDRSITTACAQISNG